MSTEPPSVSSTSVLCGKCGNANESHAQFCSGCGNGLYESCGGCSKPVTLTQPFCTGCGHDLKIALKETEARLHSLLADSVNFVKEDKFDDALALLERISTNTDYRFSELTKQATEAIAKVNTIAASKRAATEEAQRAAEPEIEAGNHKAVLAILSQASFQLLTEKYQTALKTAKSYLEQRDGTRESLKEAVEQKNWLVAGPLLDQLCNLEPDDTKYPRLAKQVGKTLLAKAKKHFEAHNYRKADQYLQSIPERSDLEEVSALSKQIGDIHWMREQLDSAVLDSPTLGKISVRSAKEEGNSKEARLKTEQIAKNLKSGERLTRSLLPYRSPRKPSWLSRDPEFQGYGFLGALSRIERANVAALNGQWGNINVAVGLGLQGLGAARITSNMVPKKGFLSGLRRKKFSDHVWAIDIGSSSVKVVSMTRTDDVIQVVDGAVYPYENSTGLGEDQSDRVSEIMLKIAETHDIGDTPVWISFPGNEVISRFCALPPAADKRIQEMVDKEMKERIPFELDELWTDSVIGPLYEENQAAGRPTTIHAVKKTQIEQRLELFEECELNIAGMQADSIALVNLIDYEFADQLGDDSEEDESEDDGDDVDQEDVHARATFPTIVLFDCGATKTTTILVSRNAHWIWTSEFGGDDLTGLLARETKVVRNEAESLKQNPQNLEHPSLQFSPIEERLDEWAAKLKRIVGEGQSAYEPFHLISGYATGGGCKVLRWFERVLTSH